MNATAPIRVLVDRRLGARAQHPLRRAQRAIRRIEVVGTAGDAHIAREKIKKLNPDVLTLDVEMPRMDGLTFLSNLMRLHPMPVVMVSSLTERGADITLDALAMGAVDFLPKPRIDIAATLQDYGDELIAKIKTAARANVRALDSRRMRTLRTREASIAATGEVAAAAHACAPPIASSPSAPRRAAPRPSRRCCATCRRIARACS